MKTVNFNNHSCQDADCQLKEGQRTTILKCFSVFRPKEIEAVIS